MFFEEFFLLSRLRRQGNSYDNDQVKSSNILVQGKFEPLVSKYCFVFEKSLNTTQVISSYLQKLSTLDKVFLLFSSTLDYYAPIKPMNVKLYLQV